MSSLPAAYATLLSQLASITTSAAGCRALSVRLAPGEDSLAWLSVQPHRPQLWWQHRDGEERIAACGALRRFVTLQQAQRAARQLPDGWRIWGGNRFDEASSFLFLPRLIWRRAGGEETLVLYLLSESDIAADARAAADFLRQLLPGGQMPALYGVLRQQRHLPERAQWQQQVAQALMAIAAGTLEKVVLARVTDLHYDQPLSPAALLAASRAVNPRCYHFMLRFDDHSALVGASPERLWLRQQDELLTEALAGTVAKDNDPQLAQRQAQWLLNDEKNAHENALVVADIRQRLRGVVSGLRVLPAETIALRNLQHLRRRIHGELRSRSDTLCLTRLQPTAAVAGLPRQAARQFLQRHEPFSREWYAGSLGYLSRRQSEFCVVLRSARLEGERVRLYAGAGIVAGSDAEQEWQEINHKAAALAALLPRTVAEEA